MSTLVFMFALAIVLGAFGAHGLRDLVSAEKLDSFKTGVLYHLITCIALMVIRTSIGFNEKFIAAFRLIFIGVILFSGSIYLLVFNAIFKYPINPILGPVTPFGGLFMITGWLQMAWIYFKQRD